MATYGRAVADARRLAGGVSCRVLAAQVQGRGAFHVQRPIQAAMGKHGVADTCAERGGGGKWKTARFSHRGTPTEAAAAAASTPEKNFSFQPAISDPSGPFEQGWFLTRVNREVGEGMG